MPRLVGSGTSLLNLKRDIGYSAEKRIEAHVSICFIAYKVLERLIAINKIGMSVNHVLDAAKTITTIRIRMPENGTYFTRTLFLTDKHLAIKPLFDLLNCNSRFGWRIDEVRCEVNIPLLSHTHP